MDNLIDYELNVALGLSPFFFKLMSFYWYIITSVTIWFFTLYFPLSFLMNKRVLLKYYLIIFYFSLNCLFFVQKWQGVKWAICFEISSMWCTFLADPPFFHFIPSTSSSLLLGFQNFSFLYWCFAFFSVIIQYWYFSFCIKYLVFFSFFFFSLDCSSSAICSKHLE